MSWLTKKIDNRTLKTFLRLMESLIVIYIIFVVFMYFATKNDNPNDTVFLCLVQERDVDVCSQAYEPVCALVNVQCITTPCEPVKETFSNSCEACRNALVDEYTIGECLSD